MFTQNKGTHFHFENATHNKFKQSEHHRQPFDPKWSEAEVAVRHFGNKGVKWHMRKQTREGRDLSSPEGEGNLL